MKKLKTVGIEEETHKRLKQLCAAEGWTMTEAVKHMLELLKKEAMANGRSDAVTEGSEKTRDR
jgi:hypothetical protein